MDIDYVYFDVDNKRILNSYEELVDVYYKGIKTIYENWYMHADSGQVLRSMSSTRETECSLRVKLIRMQNNV